MSMSSNIGGSLKIIPQNVRDVLTDAKFNEKVVSVNRESVFKGTFAEKRGAVLNDLKRLSYARKVRRNDTGGKTGFSGFLKIIGNILHNFRSHFYSSEKALADLKRDVQTLEKFGTSTEMTPSEYTQLKGFLAEIKQINENEEASLRNWKKKTSELLDRYVLGNNGKERINSKENALNDIKESNKSKMDNLTKMLKNIPTDLQGKVNDCVDMFKNLQPRPLDKEVEKFRDLLTKGSEIDKENKSLQEELRNDISECLKKFKCLSDLTIGNLFMNEVYVSNIKEMLALHREGDDEKCLEIFQQLNPSPSDIEIKEFEQLLNQRWYTEFSLGDRLEEILEKQAKKYEELNKI